MVRVLILTLGPIVLVGVSYWLAAAASRAGGTEMLRPVLPSGGASTVESDLAAACRQRASELRSRLAPECRVVARTPFVLGGDLTESELERVYRDVVLPTARALSIDYFDRPPDEPIVLLMFATEVAYREHALRLDGRDVDAYYGYYWRPERRIMLNLATGYGTLAHELTHALAHFDFPEMPEWLDEGLAALHEESDFSSDGLHLSGRPNWRGHLLGQALRGGKLQPLEGLLRAGGLRASHEAVDYAHARYVCLFLQESGLLRAYYRKLRLACERDPTGVETLLELLGAGSAAEIDREFRDWAAGVVPAVPR